MPSSALWRAPQQMIVRRPPTAVAAWLHDPGSVTQKLIDLHGALSVNVLAQSRGYPSLNESRAVGIPSRRQAIVRRVALIAAGQTRVLARTIMPDSALGGCFSRLGRTGQQPLGHLLFTDPRIRRLGYQVALLPAVQSFFPELQAPAWGRRSLFSVGTGKILVYEVFLPTLYEPEQIAVAPARKAA